MEIVIILGIPLLILLIAWYQNEYDMTVRKGKKFGERENRSVTLNIIFKSITEFLSYLSLPLNSSRRFACNIINNPINRNHFIDDSIRDPL